MYTCILYLFCVKPVFVLVRKHPRGLPSVSSWRKDTDDDLLSRLERVDGRVNLPLEVPVAQQRQHSGHPATYY